VLSLGPQALPAIDRYLATRPNDYVRDKLTGYRDQLVTNQLDELDSWRVWSFRGYRLKRYLAAGGAPPVQSRPAAGKGDKS